MKKKYKGTSERTEQRKDLIRKALLAGSPKSSQQLAEETGIPVNVVPIVISGMKGEVGIAKFTEYPQKSGETTWKLFTPPPDECAAANLPTEVHKAMESQI